MLAPFLVWAALMLLAELLDAQLRRECRLQAWPSQSHQANAAFCRRSGIPVP